MLPVNDDSDQKHLTLLSRQFIISMLLIDRENCQRAAANLYKQYRKDIGFYFKLDAKKQNRVDTYWSKKDERNQSRRSTLQKQG